MKKKLWQIYWTGKYVLLPEPQTTLIPLPIPEPLPTGKVIPECGGSEGEMKSRGMMILDGVLLRRYLRIEGKTCFPSRPFPLPPAPTAQLENTKARARVRRWAARERLQRSG